ARFTPLSTGTEMTDTAEVTFTSGLPTICGGEVDDTDPTNAVGNCLKVATDSAGQWLTSTPSIAVMNALGYAVDDSETNDGATYAATYTESGTYGPVDGVFAKFRQDGATAINPADGGDGSDGQFDRWCQKLNTLEFGGQTTWRRPTWLELMAFYQKYGDEGAEFGLWSARGWPTDFTYWASTSSNPSSYDSVELLNGFVGHRSPGDDTYASCIASPPSPTICGTGVDDT
ncbi:peptidase, partial [Vibrio parahaemolyticus]